MKTIGYNSVILLFPLALSALALTGCASSGEKKPQVAQDDAVHEYFQVLRSDFNQTKIRTLNQVMKLTPEQAEKFWPIYRHYEQELAQVGDRKLALIREFFAHRQKGTLDDANSRDIATRWLQTGQDRLDLWKKYYEKISQAVSPIQAGQFLQAENQMALFIDMSIASEMPLVTGSTPKRQ